MPTIQIDSPRAQTAELEGYLAVPKGGDGPWPGVLVIHEAWGLDDETRGAADRLAGMGFLALAPDLYRGHPIRCIRAVATALGRGHGPAFDDLEASRSALADREECTGDVGVIGFCMGGGFALLLGTTGRYRASSDNYGQLPEDLSVLRNSCPIVASYGGRDRMLRGTADRLDAALEEYGVKRDVKEYPDAGHAFLNDHRNGPVVIRPVLRAMHAGPEPASAADAWERIRVFFDEHLR
ncbi:carboxymethylenebutenolidase [Brachybacterium endophyticum]|uniref:Carboxymethylenebutenolidase n=1 Tax=Brachybacterium endophyticum TaxID=2182385 RepID=A0A2U2RJJ8_9MICO|nr:dienelactone hydrolase family protein [Brachybacterium endophyticum]PWH06052.1 carboxymethylenebutenolidase [Brachybacterium endophyticum]